MATDPAPTDRPAPPGADVIPIAGHARGSSGGQLETVYRHSYPKLVGFLSRRIGNEAEAHDLAQGAFLKLWQRRDALSDQNIVSLLFVTARNLATDVLRARMLRARSAPDDRAAERDGVPDDEPSAERVVIARRDIALVQQIIAELPAKCRTAFIEYKFEGLSYAEIAERMGVTESMVRKNVRRAMVHCIARFSDLEGWE